MASDTSQPNTKRAPEESGAEQIPEGELRQRVLYALLKPVVRLAGAADVPLADVVDLLQTAYFQEVRQRGLTLEQAAEKLAVSRRTAARLSKQLKQRFVAPEVGHNLPRRIEFMVAAEPMSRARVVQALREHPREDVDTAIDQLLAEERVEVRPGRTPTLHAVVALRQLARDTWIRRVGGLTSFAENLADAAHGRFFADAPAAFARTLSFRVPRGAHTELEALYREHILPRVVELDSTDDDAADEPMQLSICWAPYDLVHGAEADQDPGGDA